MSSTAELTDARDVLNLDAPDLLVEAGQPWVHLPDLSLLALNQLMHNLGSNGTTSSTHITACINAKQIRISENVVFWTLLSVGVYLLVFLITDFGHKHKENSSRKFQRH